MPALTRTIETDVCVVGAGLVGLAHAHAARRRGLNVIVLERDVRAVGGSVRHAGHLFFSALPVGGALDTAELARERWLELLRRAGAFVDEAGTVIVARNSDELAVMEAAAAEREERARMLTPDGVTELAQIPVRGLVGGFHGMRDLRVDPRAVTAALARLLAQDPSARIEWGTQVTEVEPGLVHAGQLRVRAQAIVVCPGTGQPPVPVAIRPRGTEIVDAGVQMLRVAAPTGRRYRPALATGLSLLQHPAFSAQPGGEQLRARAELEHPELVERGIQVLVTQVPGGDLIIGESRTFEKLAVPFLTERGYRLLLEQAQMLLGSRLEVRQRWIGMEARPSTGGPGEDLRVTAPLPGVRVVQCISPLALAVCHLKASEVLSELLLEDAAFGNADVHNIVVTDQREATGLRAHPDVFTLRRASTT